MTNKTETRIGLRDVIAGDTHICDLDEGISRVFIYGYSLEELIEQHTFEETAYLTLFGELPAAGYKFAAPELSRLRSVWDSMAAMPKNAHPMGLLRSAMSKFGNVVDAEEPDRPLVYEAERAEALKYTPHVGYLAGLVGLHRDGAGYVEPDLSKGYGGAILSMLRGGQAVDEFEARCMDIALILYIEHEFNAGSFGVRVSASAHSDLYGSMVAGEAILRGTRHGSANEEVMKMLVDEGGNPDAAKAYLDNFFAQPGARIPGFGHAVYNLPHSVDPRTVMLKPWVRELSRRHNDMRWYETILAFEDYMAERMKPRVERGQPNAPGNADLWTAPLYYLLGIPIPMYTPLFAASRVAGWAAHYLETRYVNAEPILRPRAEYVGPPQRQFEDSPLHGAPRG
jgi:citrate synthase